MDTALVWAGPSIGILAARVACREARGTYVIFQLDL
jgi:hypothetical protein